MTRPKQNKKNQQQLQAELLDRLYLAYLSLEQNCLNHPVTRSDKKTKALITGACSQLIKAYSQIGKLTVADGKKTKFQKMTSTISEQLNQVIYRHGDLSDIGNEIGFAIGEHLKKEENVDDFISGLTHGISLKNNTHG